MQGWDWFFLDRMFQGCMSDTAVMITRIPPSFHSDPLIEDEDVTITNLVGCCDIIELAQRWVESSSIRRKLEIARSYLKPPERILVNRILGDSSSLPLLPPFTVEQGKGERMQDLHSSSDNDTDDDSERGRTAHKLFASSAGVDEKVTSWWSSPPSSDREFSQLNNDLENSSPSKALFEKSMAHLISNPTCPQDKPPSNIVPQLATPLPGHLYQVPPRHVDKGLALPFCPQSSSPAQKNSTNSVKRKSQPPAAKTSISLLGEQKNNGSEDIDNSLTFPFTIPNSSCCQRCSRYTVPPTVVLSDAFSPDTINQQMVAPNLPVLRRVPRASLLQRYSRTRSFSEKPQVERAHYFLQRIKIGERLANARPDAMTPSYASKRAKLLARYEKLETKKWYARATINFGDGTVAQNAVEHENDGRPVESIFDLRTRPTVSSFEAVHDGDDVSMDWERSRGLADRVRSAIASGKPIPLPGLKCADSQSSQYAFR